VGYSSVTDVQNVMAQALTSATTSTLSGTANLLNVGRVLDTNLVSTDLINSYITYADNQIDSYISSNYKTPLCELADFESGMYSSISDYNSYIVIEKACPLSVGDTILLIEGDYEERHTIDDVVGVGVFSTSEPIQYEFSTDARLIRVKFPDPITLISARFAAANIFDKYFSSQNSPNISEYGRHLRDMARADINNILNGRTVLHGQHRIGRRFFNSNLVDQYDLVRGSEGSKDISDLSK